MHRLHYSLEADDFDDGAADGEFNGELEIDFDEFLDETAGLRWLQQRRSTSRRSCETSQVTSDSRTATRPQPRFINALGEEEADDRDPNGETHNVIGVLLTPRGLHRRD